uniref:Protein kinase domain-containing protein n=1 Tax=Clastoptera arizonana TaxID=38151 RepID=A0A1B6DIJ0_9HEMI
MDNIWLMFGLYFGLNFLGLCYGHPIDPKELSAGVPFAIPVLGLALLTASVVCLALCVCCRQQQRKGFKEFTDSTSTQNLHHAGRGFTNPGLTPGSELSIFPPPGAVPVTFEPLPNIVPPVQTPRSRKPHAYNLVTDVLSDTDWFRPNQDFPRQQLHYLRECGRGWFGRVVEGEAKGIKENLQSKVVVKILREDATQAEQKFFLNEVKPYRDLNHNNVLKLVGRCLETNPYLILLEACTSGDLKSFLANNMTTSGALVQQGVCLRMMCQVSSGLQHMIQHGFVHTDLAARNCLVTSDLTVKVGDYGTSIETYKSDYYITEDMAIPIRWCSPETLLCTDTTIETKPVKVAANIWSLGVVLWEICEFGHLPYSELTDDQVILKVLCSEGVRLTCPTSHPLHASHLYSLMQMCWQQPNRRPSIEHILAMLLHLQTTTVSDSDEDFERRWETLKPNTIPITDNHLPKIPIEGLTIKSEFDSGVDLEIKANDPEVLDIAKRLSSEDVNRSPSITASPQPSVTSSSGGEFFTSSGLSTIQRHLSPSMTNLRGSVEDITKTVEEKNEDVSEEFDSWLKGVDTTNEEDVKFVRKISEAIKDLDDALALEKTSSSESSSRQESPMKSLSVLNENPVLDFRLGPIGYKDSGMQLDSLQDDSLVRRDSSTDTEEETWRGRIERGEFSEKVKEKSRSVADLMILTHIENSSDESDSLPSLTRQYSIEKIKRFGKVSPMMTSIGFGSEGNIKGAVLGEEFQESLKQLQAEWKIKESESREASLVDPCLYQKDKLDFLSNDASGKNNFIVNNTQVTAIVPSQESLDLNSSVPVLGKKIDLEVVEKDCILDNVHNTDGSELLTNDNNFLEVAYTTSNYNLGDNKSFDLCKKNDKEFIQAETIISSIYQNNISEERHQTPKVNLAKDVESSKISNNHNPSKIVDIVLENNNEIIIRPNSKIVDCKKTEILNCETNKVPSLEQMNGYKVINIVEEKQNNSSTLSDVVKEGSFQCINRDVSVENDNKFGIEVKNEVASLSVENSLQTTNIQNIRNENNTQENKLCKINNILTGEFNKHNLNDDHIPHEKEECIIDNLVKPSKLIKNSTEEKDKSATYNNQELIMLNGNHQQNCNTKEMNIQGSDFTKYISNDLIFHEKKQSHNSISVAQKDLNESKRSIENNETIIEKSISNDEKDLDAFNKVFLHHVTDSTGNSNSHIDKKNCIPNNVIESFVIQELGGNLSSSINTEDLNKYDPEQSKDIINDVIISTKSNLDEDLSCEDTIKKCTDAKAKFNESKETNLANEFILKSSNFNDSDISFIPTKLDDKSCLTEDHLNDDVLNIGSNKPKITSVPEIVITEASNLDIDSEPEETIPYRNTATTGRKIRIVVSSSDESDEEIDTTPLPFVCSTAFKTNESADHFNAETFFVPLSEDNESCVILGSCEDYTLDYFKGLKTTLGKATDVDSSDDEDKPSEWDEFFNKDFVDSEKSHCFSNVFINNNCEKNNENSNDLCDFVLNKKLVGGIGGKNEFHEEYNDNTYSALPTYVVENMSMNRTTDNYDKDVEMEEVKNRLEKVAELSQGFCLKGPSTSVEDEEDGKFLTPDDERSSDSGFRDKGSLSESVEDACDEKYNLEDIEAELEDIYVKNKSDSPNSGREQEKIYIIEHTDEQNVSFDNEHSEMDTKTISNEFIAAESKYNCIKYDKTSLENKSDLVQPQCNQNTNNIHHEELFCLSESEHVDLHKKNNEEKFNKLDSALDADIDLFFESKNVNDVKTGWYLHPPTDKSTNGWLPTPVATEEVAKENSYVSFHIDEEFVTAIRNELREKLPCAQNLEPHESEEDTSPEEERTDMVIQYNSYPAPLSPIYEERESLSSNQSSLLLDQKSFDSSGKSSPILYLDLPIESVKSFEDVIKNEISEHSEITDSDTALVVEDLEEKKSVKINENVKEDCDDVLIIDTETNKATLLENPVPKSQLAFVKSIQEDNSSEISSDMLILTRSEDDDKPLMYTPDSVSPLSSGSSRTGVALSFSSSETGNLSGFYLSPSSVRSDLFDNGPPSLPFDIGTLDTVEEIHIKPNNEAAEIVQELIDLGVLKNINTSKNDRTNKISKEEHKVNLLDANNSTIKINDTTIENANPDKSQTWLKSILLPEPNSSANLSLNKDSWPTVDELLPNKTEDKISLKLENVLTPDSPCVDLNELGKCDINSTLALSTPNLVNFSDESKDNSQLSSFSSTPTLDTIKSIADKLTTGPEDNSLKIIVPPSLLVKDSIENSNDTEVSDITPEEERAMKLQGMTLALEPVMISKAPMPSPEDADKGLWRPTIGQLLELTNQQMEQDDMMTTSFIDVDNNDDQYTPDWESETSESEEHSSSSGEFIWKEGSHEDSIRAAVATNNAEQNIIEEEGEEVDTEGKDDSSCGSATEFVPSFWDSSATPVKSALKSGEKKSSEKKNVSFKLQKYHCVYEYPKEASDSEDEDGTRRCTWQTPTFDYSTFADWELGEGEIEVEAVDSDGEDGVNAVNSDQKRSEYDFYRLSGLDFDMGYMTSDDGEFYISSSAKPFHQFLTDDAAGSEFFPGANDDFETEFNPLASDLESVNIENDKKDDLIESGIKSKHINKPSNLYIPPEPVQSEELSSAEVSPGLGELRHTRQRLKLDLHGTVKNIAEPVKGEASLLDSGEDSGIEANALVRLKDSTDSSSEA